MNSPKDKISETAGYDQHSARPLEFQDSTLAEDTQPSEAHNEDVDNKTPIYEDKSNLDISSTKTDNYLIEVKVTCRINFLLYDI